MFVCPKCKVTLEPLSYKGVTIDKCPNCEGVWLDKGEDAFATEILKNANKAACKECSHFEDRSKKCELLKIFVDVNFSCSHYTKY